RAQSQGSRRNARHTGMQAPGARLELELAVLDVEIARTRLLELELREELARLLLRGDEPERADEEKEEVQLRHASGSIRESSAGSSGTEVRSATRKTALRARGLAAISRAVGRCGRPMILSGGCGISLARSGNSRGTSGFASARTNRLTMRSSSEWKL